jgi:hypothetical protein
MRVCVSVDVSANSKFSAVQTPAIDLTIYMPYMRS